MPKQKKAIWFHKLDESLINSKIEILEKFGFLVSGIKNTEGHILPNIQNLRPSLILISESSNQKATIEQIKHLSYHTDSKSIPIILVQTSSEATISAAAAINGFRNLIHIHAPKMEWERVLSTTLSQKPMVFKQRAGQVGLSYLCEIKIPIRVVSLKNHILRFESSFRSRVGKKVKISCELFNSAGDEVIEVEIVKSFKSHLLYRFSFGYEANISSQLEKQQLEKINHRLEKTEKPAPTRVFTIIRHRSLKKSIHNLLTGSDYHVNTAMQLRHILEEPDYLSPDIIVIERHFTEKEHQERFKSLLAKLTEQTQIIIITDTSQPINLEISHPNLSYFKASYNQKNSFRLDGFIDHCQTNKSSHNSGHINPNSSESYGWVSAKSYLRSAHPTRATISSSLLLSQFALVEIKSSFFQHKVNAPIWLKVSSCYSNQSEISDSKEHYIAEGDIVGISPNTRTEIASSLLQILSRHLSHYTRSINEDIADFGNEANTQRSKEKSLSAYKKVLHLEQKPITNPTLQAKIHKTAAHSKVEKPFFTPENFKTIGKAVAILIAVAAIIFLIRPILKKDLERSGRIYIDNLLEFQNSQKKSKEK